jgi:hypothetical protein
MNELLMGTVKKVDPVNYSVDVEVEDNKRLVNVQCVSSCFNTLTGSGLVFNPEIESKCIVTRLKDSRYVVLGFIALICTKVDKENNKIDGQTGYKSARPDKWEMADVGLVGPLGNRVQVQSSGVVNIGSSENNQIYLVPDLNNIIIAITDNLHAFVGNSEITLTNDRVRKSTDFEFICESTPTDVRTTRSTGVVKVKMGKNADLLKILIDDNIVLSIGKDKSVEISGSVFNVKIGDKSTISVDKNRNVTINNSLMVKP